MTYYIYTLRYQEGSQQRKSTIITELSEEEVNAMIGYNVEVIKCEKYKGKIMNVHPSLLPAFGGGTDKNVHQDVLESGVNVTGATIHFVTKDLDSGPIIMQKSVPVSEDDTVETLKDKVQKAEQEMFPKAIQLFAEGKLKIEGNKVKILE